MSRLFLSENALARSVVGALTIHVLLLTLFLLSGARYGALQIVTVPVIDPNVRVIFSPWGGNLPAKTGGAKKHAPEPAPIKKSKKSPAKPIKDDPHGRAALPTKKSKKDLEKERTKKAQEVKKPVKKPEPPKKPEPVPLIQKTEPQQKPAEQPSQVIPEQIVVGRAAYEEYRVGRDVRTAVERVWVAPRGATSEHRCVLAIQIDAQGQVKNIETRTSSGSALYDSAARYAAMQASYPREVWSRLLILEFAAG